MLASQFIVVLWFFPVVLFILIPLAILSVWLLYYMLKTITINVGRVHNSAGQFSNSGYASTQTRLAT